MTAHNPRICQLRSLAGEISGVGVSARYLDVSRSWRVTRGPCGGRGEGSERILAQTIGRPPLPGGSSSRKASETSQQWSKFVSTLVGKNYRVFGMDCNSTYDIGTSAKKLSTFVDKVLRSTGAAKVDLVGNSQGEMLPRCCFRNLGGASRVHRLIGIALLN